MDKTPKQWLQHRNIVFHNLPKIHQASCVLNMAKFKAFHEIPGNFRPPVTHSRIYHRIVAGYLIWKMLKILLDLWIIFFRP